jgi:glucose-6-phosphate-specific signal transduction histidine kinase
MKSLKNPFKERMAVLSSDNRQLRRDLVRNTKNESLLQKRCDRYEKLWSESLVLQKDLRSLTHQLLLSQEDQRFHISHQLQDEIGQALLGIQIRLSTMRRKTAKDTRVLKDGIASTQRMVHDSERAVRIVTKKTGNK